MNAAHVAAILLKHLIPALQQARLELDAAELYDGSREPRIFAPAEAAEYLGISESQLRILTERGGIPCRRLSDRIVRYSEKALVEYVGAGDPPEPSATRRAG